MPGAPSRGPDAPESAHTPAPSLSGPSPGCNCASATSPDGVKNAASRGIYPLRGWRARPARHRPPRGVREGGVGGTVRRLPTARHGCGVGGACLRGVRAGAAAFVSEKQRLGARLGAGWRRHGVQGHQPGCGRGGEARSSDSWRGAGMWPPLALLSHPRRRVVVYPPPHPPSPPPHARTFPHRHRFATVLPPPPATASCSLQRPPPYAAILVGPTQLPPPTPPSLLTAHPPPVRPTVRERLLRLCAPSSLRPSWGRHHDAAPGALVTMPPPLRPPVANVGGLSSLGSRSSVMPLAAPLGTLASHSCVLVEERGGGGWQ